jgi:NAD(P)-dependent dehydrogenase (short-subunit alcohol dehydrogenase family)
MVHECFSVKVVAGLEYNTILKSSMKLTRGQIMDRAMDLEGKTFIITGANSGIGFATARQMAKAGATVVMGTRSIERGTAAQVEIVKTTGNEQVHLLQVDMASSSLIRTFTENFRERFERLDGLINNAADFDLSKTTPSFTDSGAEVIFATNHLGPFLLTYLLLDLLKASIPSRVVNISSKGLLVHPFLKIHFDDLSASRKRKFSPAYAYYHSKLSHLMFTRELARRLEGSGVTTNAIRVPNVRIDVSRYPDIHPLLLKMYDLKQRSAITPDKMAETYLKVATAPELSNANGMHFDERARPVPMPRFAMDDQACARLWEISEGMVGVKYPEKV